ncbi:MFS transporter [Roseibium sp.]|uniref:MFS transporter n=3 Tax=Roseibium sp. TaxID=1936156 RepID=UPI003D0EE067
MESRFSRRNWHCFLLHGLFYSLKRRLAPPKVFLPFICVAAGAPVFLAAMIVPVFNIAQRSSELLSAPLVSNADQRRTFVIFGITGIAMGLLLAIVAIDVSVPVLTVVCLGISAVLIGIGRGVGGLAHAALLPSLFDRPHRTHLLNILGVLSACAAIAVAFAAYHLFQGHDPLDSHLALAWLALAMAFPAALLLVFVVEPDKPRAAREDTPEPRAHGSEKMLVKFAYCWRYDWFRRFLTARILLLSVTHVMPFYAIHAASLHKDQTGSYAAFVVAMSAGAVLSGPVLYALTSRSVSLNLAVSALAGMVAAVLALAVDMMMPEPRFYYYVPVLVLNALGAQVAMVALAVYLGERAEDGNREYFIATSRFSGGVVGVAVAAALGVMAQIHNEAIPIAVILGFNLLALVYVLWCLPGGAEQS